jgi:hypothetical protein
MGIGVGEAEFTKEAGAHPCSRLQAELAPRCLVIDSLKLSTVARAIERPTYCFYANPTHPLACETEWSGGAVIRK